MSTTGAAPAAAAAAAAAAENVAQRVAEVSIDVAALQGVQGTIKVKHAKRRVSGNAAAAAAAAANGSGAQPLGGQVSEGPQEIVAQARQVMNVTLTDREAPAGPFNNIQVFFYDEWAEWLEGVLQRGMRLTISGPPEIVREHTGSQDHFYALVIAPQTLLGGNGGGGGNGVHTLTLAIRPAGGGAAASAAGGPMLELTQGMDAGVVAQRIEAFQSALTNAAAATARSGAAAGRGGGGGGGGSKRGPMQYAYMDLGDLVLPRFKGREVNVYGVVAGFTQPRRTAGTDHMCSLLLVHPSRATQPRKLSPPPNMPPPGGQQQEQQQGEFEVEQVHPMQLVMRCVVVCNVFRTDLAWLPRPLQVGEIVRLHRVKVNEFQNNVQLVCNRHAQFLLVRRRPLPPGAAPSATWVDGEWERVASSETHTFTEQDRKTIPWLWAWAHNDFLPHASLLDRFSPGPRTVEQVRKRLHNLPWRPRTAASGQAGAEGENGEGEEEEQPAPPQYGGQQQQQGDDRQVGDFVGLVLARPGADSVVLWDGTDGPVPSATAQLFPAAVVRACHAALAAAHAHQGEGAGQGEGQGPWVEACGGSAAEAAEQAVPTVEVLGPAMREAGRLEVLLPSVHRWRVEGMAASGQLAPGTWVRLRHLEVQEVGALGPLGGGVGQWQYQQQQRPGQQPQGATQVAAAGMNASLNALPPYSLDVQRVACRFLARQRQRTIPTCLMPFYHRGHPHLTGLPRAYVVEALGSTAPATFALRVRIAGFWPRDLRRACVPQAPSTPPPQAPPPPQGPQQDQQWTFFFTIRLGDETGALDALVCGGGADFFLGDTPGVRACDLSQPANAAVLHELQRLLGKRVAEGKAYDLLVQSCLVPPVVAEGGRAVKRFRVLAIPDVRSGNGGGSK